MVDASPLLFPVLRALAVGEEAANGGPRYEFGHVASSDDGLE
jgi:hypothetical protein